MDLIPTVRGPGFARQPSSKKWPQFALPLIVFLVATSATVTDCSEVYITGYYGSIDGVSIAMDSTETNLFLLLKAQWDTQNCPGCTPTTCFPRATFDRNTWAISKIGLNGNDPVTYVYTKMWETTPASDMMDPQGMCIDGSNNPIMVGNIWNNNRLLGYSYPIPAATGHAKNSLILKIQGSDGADLWATDPVQSLGTDTLRACVVDGSGDVYAVGMLDAAAAGHVYGGVWDGIIVKVRGTDGSKVWSYQTTGAGDEYFQTLVLGASNDIWIAGHEIGALTVWQVTTAGTLSSQRSVTPNGGWQLGRKIVRDSSDNLYVMSYGLGGLNSVAPMGELSVFVTKFNAARTVVWVKQLGSPLNDYESGLSLSPDESMLHATISTETLIAGLSAFGQFDIVYYRLNPTTGAIDDVFQYGTTTYDEVRYTIVDSSNNVYAAGLSRSAGVVFRLTPKENCPAGSEYNVIRDQPFNWNMCGFCPGNSVSAVAGSTSCTACFPGYVKSAGNTTCAICPANTRQLGSECVPCGGGTSASAGSTKCLSCSLGYFANEDSACEACPRGTYGYMVPDGIGGFDASCSPCPLGSTTYSSGMTQRSLCTCLKTQYGNPLDPINPAPCLDCPPNSICDGGTTPQAIAGYYLSSSAIGNGGVKCIPESACPGGVDACEEGYTGDSCSSCASGYYTKDGICTKCLQNNYLMIAALFVTAVVGGILLCCIGLCWVCSKTLRRFRRALLPLAKSAPALARIVALQIAFLQIMQTMLTMGINISFPLKESFSGLFSVVSLDVSSLTSTECASGSSLSYAHKHALKLVLPVLLVGGLFILALLVAVVKGALATFVLMKKKVDLKMGEGAAAFLEHPVVTAFLDPLLGSTGVVLMGVNIIYYAVHISVMDPFRCSETSGKWVVTSTPSVTCYVTEGDWIIAVSVSVFGFLIYSLGIPLFFLVVTCIFSNPKWRHESIFSTKLFSFLWEKYEDELYFWECVVTAKKMMVGIAVMGIVTGPYDQGAAVFLILLLALVMHSLFRPFKSAAEDYLELVSLVCALILSFLGVVSESDSSRIGVTPEMSKFLEIFTVAVIIFQGLFCLGAVFVLVGTAIRESANTPGHHQVDVTKEDNPFEDSLKVPPHLRTYMIRRDRLRQEVSTLKSQLKAIK